jgi:hypothetical protein
MIEVERDRCGSRRSSPSATTAPASGAASPPSRPKVTRRTACSWSTSPRRTARGTGCAQRWPAVEHLLLARPDLSAGELLDAALARIDADLVAFLAPGDAWPVDALARLAKAATTGEPCLLLPCERLSRGRDDGRPPRAEPVPIVGDGDELPLSSLCCRAELLRGSSQGAGTIAAEVLARLGARPGSPLAGAPVILDAAPAAVTATAATPAAWVDLLRAAGAAGLAAASPVILVGLDAADRPAGHLNLLGHAAPLAAPGRPVEAYTLADLSPSALDDAPAAAALVATTAGDFGIGNAAAQLCFEELLRRLGKRPVRLALRHLAPSSLELGGRLIEAVRGHPDLEVWVNDAVSRAYAALVFGPSRARLVQAGHRRPWRHVLGQTRDTLRGSSGRVGPEVADPGFPQRRTPDWRTERLGTPASTARPVAASGTSWLASPAPPTSCARRRCRRAWSLLLSRRGRARRRGRPDGYRLARLALFAALSGRTG